jgi:tungstate transport system substrate-binding protein
LAVALAVAAVVLAGCTSGSARPVVTIGTTTTTQDSGLLDVLLPAFENDTGIHARAVVAGSGEILAKAARGDVDVLLAHSRAAELVFVRAGDGTRREPVMYNRFFLVGPASDPAGAGNATSASDAFLRIYQHRAGVTFASRGDESGTHVRELSIWSAAGLNASMFDPAWYEETGSGQSETLRLADEKGSYALSDEATWAQLRQQGQLSHLAILYRDDPSAFRNLYGVTPVNATRHPGVREDLGDAFAAWVTGPRGQAVIASYRVGGEQVFFGDAGAPDG